MKKILILVLFLGIIFFNSQGSPQEKWQEQKSTHFIVYFQKGVPADYVQNTINTAEKAYDRLGDKLKLRRFDYWTWENRAKIYIYASKDTYLEGSGREEWSGGSVDIDKKTIKCFPSQQDFFDRVLPHELTHIVFREYVGNETDLPLWLDEGMACSSEERYYQRYIVSACSLFKQDMILNLNTLNQINHSSLSAPIRFYVSSVALVYYLWEKFGAEDFRKMCFLMREKGYTIEEALLEVYPFKTLDELDAAWFAYLNSHCG